MLRLLAPGSTCHLCLRQSRGLVIAMTAAPVKHDAAISAERVDEVLMAMRGLDDARLGFVVRSAVPSCAVFGDLMELSFHS